VFTVLVLAAMAAALGFVRFHVLPQQEDPEPLAFAWVNPMLDARPGEKAVFFRKENPGQVSCSVVRPEGVVLRPHDGPDRIGPHGDLRQALPYLPCSIREGRRAGASCDGPESDTVLYALNYFGMPGDTYVRVDSIRPRWMSWGGRDLVVYEVVFERYGALGGRWTTYLSEAAPVAGLVKWTSLLPHRTEVHYREPLPE
jgi:hypothetical protein